MRAIETLRNQTADIFAGLRALQTYVDTKGGLAVDPTLSRQLQIVRPILAGEPTDITTSLVKLITKHPVLHWIREYEASFVSALDREPQIRLTLASINEAVSDLQSVRHIDEQTSKLYTLALTESLAQLVKVAYPYMPKYVARDIKKPDFPDAQKKMRTPRNLENPQLSKRDPVESIKRWLEQIDDFLGRHELGEHQYRSDRRSSEYFHSPLLDKTRAVGKRRSGSNFLDRRIMLSYEKFWRFKPKDVFIVTHIYNRYDADKGELSAVSPMRRMHTSYGPNETIVIPLGILDESTTSIAIPFPVHSESTKRYENYRETSSICSIKIMDTHRKEPIYGMALARALIVDSLGNRAIDLSKINADNRKRLLGKQLQLEVEECTETYNYSREDLVPELIGPLTTQERQRIGLLPREIRELLRVMQQKKEKGASNKDIFCIMAQFLGNYYLTYDERDAGFEGSDLVGFRQTERVFAHRRTSCEGANISLGQLMRYFLDPGEGIAYVEGYMLHRRDKATAKNFHLKVLYIDTDGRRHFLDMTPWGENSHTKFSRYTRRYKKLKREWNTLTDVRESAQSCRRLNLRLNAKGAANRLNNAWQAGGAYFHADAIFARSGGRATYDELPGWKEGSLDFFAESKISYTLPNRFLKNIYDPKSDVVKRLKEENCTDLLTFLQSYHGVPQQLRSFWRSDTTIDGTIDFEFPLAAVPFYTSYELPVDPEEYMYGGQDARRLLLNNSLTRHWVFEQMNTIYRQALDASKQNIWVFDILASQIEALSVEYHERLRQIFSTLQEDIATDISDFMSQAPFLLLLNSPLNSLYNLFERSIDEPTLGYIYPETPQSIGYELQMRLRHWRTKREEELSMIEHWMKTAPRTQTKKREEVKVSSLLLWQQIGLLKNQSQPIPEEKAYLDPMDTFVYLLEQFKANED